MKELTLAPRIGDAQGIVVAIENDLPDYFREILTKYSGLKVLENKYKDPTGKIWGLKSFKTVIAILNLSERFLEWEIGLYVPFAHNSEGWHFCLSYEESSYGKIIVFIWTEKNNEFIVIADNL